MQEQQIAGKARIIGYGVGMVAVVAIIAWRLIAR
jgi:hypothetical protein